MDKEIKKWKKKHTEAIRASMANPGMYTISLDHLPSVSWEEIRRSNGKITKSNFIWFTTVHLFITFKYTYKSVITAVVIVLWNPKGQWPNCVNFRTSCLKFLNAGLLLN